MKSQSNYTFLINNPGLLQMFLRLQTKIQLISKLNSFFFSVHSNLQICTVYLDTGKSQQWQLSTTKTLVKNLKMKNYGNKVLGSFLINFFADFLAEFLYENWFRRR